MNTTLYNKNGSTDKVYRVTLTEEACGGFSVFGESGRRGSALKKQPKTKKPEPFEVAQKIDDKLVKSKLSKGYYEGEDGISYVGSDKESQVSGIGCQLLNPVDEKDMFSLMTDDQYFMQEKFDGERRMVKCLNGEVQGINRKGLYVSLPSNIVEHALALGVDFVIDGEQVGDTLYAFDLLSLNGLDVTMKDASYRLVLLDSILGESVGNDAIKLVTTAFGSFGKAALFSKVENLFGEGVVFKLRTSQYVSGRPSSKGTQLKYKFYKECSVVITALNNKRSVAMGVYDGSVLTPIGNVTIPANQPIPEVGDIAEIRYLYAYKFGSLYQPTYKFPRNDINVSDCTIEQLIYKKEESVS